MPVLADFQLLLFDVDKTLTNSQREISPVVKQALQELTTRNVQIGLCTGRPYPTLNTFIMPHFPTGALHVLCGGAQVMTTEGKVLFEKFISLQAVTALIAELQRSQADFFTYDAKYVYATKNLLPRLASHPWKVAYKKIDELPKQQVPVISIPELTPEINAVLEKFPDLTIKRMINYTGQPYCDITAAGVTKDVGVRELSRLSGIPTSKMIGFGDSENDLEFLQEVGFAVVMGNGTAELKKLGDRVIGDTDADGLGIYLTSILKGNAL